MKLVCVNCGNSFNGNNDKFCSQSCTFSYIAAVEKRGREAVRDDPGHTEKLSRD